MCCGGVLMERIQMHRALGLSDEEMKEINEEMYVLLGHLNNAGSAAETIAVVYDPASVLVGMQFMQLVRLVDERAAEKEKAVEKTVARRTLTPPLDPDLN